MWGDTDKLVIDTPSAHTGNVIRRGDVMYSTGSSITGVVSGFTQKEEFDRRMEQLENALREIQIRSRGLRRYDGPQMIELSCPHCGAPAINKVDDHILKCPYCKSAYFVGTDLIRAI